jgi:antitoxin component YwqK of YwqJK toxin-antitoxin module
MESRGETRRVLLPDDTVLATTEFLDGVLDGVRRSASMNGELRQEGHCERGKLHGRFTTWWDYGDLQQQEQYDSGNRFGRYEWFDREDATLRVVEFPSVR